MGNNISQDSYLNPTTCGGRNITWAYLKYNGTLPSPYAECPNAARVLKLHCCEDGVCRPSSMDHEFDRYDWYDWNGLGWPYTEGDGKVIVGGKKNGKACKPPFIRRSFGREMEVGDSGLRIGSAGYGYPYRQSIEAPTGGMDPGIPGLVIMCVGVGGALLGFLIYLLCLISRRMKQARSVLSIEDEHMTESEEGEEEEDEEEEELSM